MTRLLCAALSAILLAAGPASGAPALWRVSDADTQMFVFGTVHVLAPDAAWMDAELEAAIDAADVLVLETELDGDAQARAGVLAERHSRLPEGETLSAVLGPDAAMLDRAAGSLGFDPAALQSYRPWMASLVLSLRFAQLQGQDQDAGADKAILARARAGGVRLAYLETPEEQIQIFAGLSPEGERDMLVSTVREIVETPDILSAMDAAWLSGDVEALGELVVDGMQEEAPALYEAALVRRNRDWAEQLGAMMDAPGRIFVAVGAGHMAGPDSLLELMSDRGFAVERVR